MASPFRIFRKHQKVMIATLGILAMVAFVFLDPLMSLLGGGGRSGGPGNPVVISWDNGELREADLQRMLRMRAVLNDFVQTAWQLGAMASGTEGGTPPNFGPVSERAVVQTALFAKAAEDQGFVVSDATINRYIQRVTNNSVTPARLRDIVAKRSVGNMLVTMDTIFAGLRTELLAQALVSNYLIAADSATPLELWLQWQRLNDRATVEVAAVPVASFVSQVADPTDAELQTFYETHKDIVKRPEIIAGTQLESPQPGFKIPRQAAFAYVRADYEKFVDRLMPEVTDQEIAEYYEQNKRNFVRPTLLEDQPEGPSERPPSGADQPTPPAANGTPPAAETPKTEEPKTEEPKTEGPKTDEPKAEEPKAEEGKTEEPKGDEPKTDAPKSDESKTEESETDEPKAQEPKGEEAKAEEPESEEPKGDDPEAERPKTEEPTTDEPKTEEPDSEEPEGEEPKTEEPKTEEPKPQEPKVEEPTTDEPKTEEPDSEEPKGEEPKTEEPKPQEPKAEEPKTEEPEAEGPGAEAPETDEPETEEPKTEEPEAEGDDQTGLMRRSRFRLVAQQTEEVPAAEVADTAGPADTKADESGPNGAAAATVPAATEPDAGQPAAARPAAEPDTPQPVSAEPTSGEVATPPTSPAPDSGSPTAASPASEQPESAPAGDAAAGTAPAGEQGEPEYMSLDEVKDEIRRDLARQRAPEKMDAVLEPFRKQLRRYFEDLQVWIVESEDTKKGTAAPPRPELPDAAAWAKENDLTYETTPLTSEWDLQATEYGRSVVIADGRPLASEAFTVLEDYKPVVTADRLGNRYLAWRVRATEERTPKLEEIRQQLITAWKMSNARELTRKEAQRLADQVRAAGKPMAEVLTKEKGYNVIRSDPFSWYTVGPIPGGREMRMRLSQVYGVDAAGPDFMAVVFKLEDGQVVTATNHPQTICYVVRLAGREQSQSAMHADFLRDYEILGRIVRQQNSMQMISTLLRDLQESQHVEGWEKLDMPRRDAAAS